MTPQGGPNEDRRHSWIWIAEEAMAILTPVAQVVYPRDPSDEALRAEIADAEALVVSFYPRVSIETC
jgi:hypothetical protein